MRSRSGEIKVRLNLDRAKSTGRTKHYTCKEGLQVGARSVAPPHAFGLPRRFEVYGLIVRLAGTFSILCQVRSRFHRLQRQGLSPAAISNVIVPRRWAPDPKTKITGCIRTRRLSTHQTKQSLNSNPEAERVLASLLSSHAPRGQRCCPRFL